MNNLREGKIYIINLAGEKKNNTNVIIKVEKERTDDFVIRDIIMEEEFSLKKKDLGKLVIKEFKENIDNLKDLHVYLGIKTITSCLYFAEKMAELVEKQPIEKFEVANEELKSFLNLYSKLLNDLLERIELEFGINPLSKLADNISITVKFKDKDGKMRTYTNGIAVEYCIFDHIKHIHDTLEETFSNMKMDKELKILYAFNDSTIDFLTDLLDIDTREPLVIEFDE